MVVGIMDSMIGSGVNVVIYVIMKDMWLVKNLSM